MSIPYLHIKGLKHYVERPQELSNKEMKALGFKTVKYPIDSYNLPPRLIRYDYSINTYNIYSILETLKKSIAYNKLANLKRDPEYSNIFQKLYMSNGLNLSIQGSIYHSCSPTEDLEKLTDYETLQIDDYTLIEHMKNYNLCILEEYYNSGTYKNVPKDIVLKLIENNL